MGTVRLIRDRTFLQLTNLNSPSVSVFPTHAEMQNAIAPPAGCLDALLLSEASIKSLKYRENERLFGKAITRASFYLRHLSDHEARQKEGARLIKLITRQTWWRAIHCLEWMEKSGIIFVNPAQTLETQFEAVWARASVTVFERRREELKNAKYDIEVELNELEAAIGAASPLILIQASKG